MTPHPHKALIDAITSGAAVEEIDDATVAPSHWTECSKEQALFRGAAHGWHLVRLKPADTHLEKTVRYPVLMQVMPEYGGRYVAVRTYGIVELNWWGDVGDKAYFNSGLCYEIHREAEAREAWQARFGGDWK